MTAGYWLFLASATAMSVYAKTTARAVTRTGGILWASVAAYVVPSLMGGYGFAGQCIGAGLCLLVLTAGLPHLWSASATTAPPDRRPGR